ncbi:MAG: hypothetical protein ACFB2Y_02690 [Fulvivirga sp.]
MLTFVRVLLAIYLIFEFELVSSQNLDSLIGLKKHYQEQLERHSAISNRYRDSLKSVESTMQSISLKKSISDDENLIINEEIKLSQYAVVKDKLGSNGILFYEANGKKVTAIRFVDSEYIEISFKGKSYYATASSFVSNTKIQEKLKYLRIKEGRKPLGNSSQSSGGRRYIRGPRGGCYYINSNGNKTYVDRSKCS